ncbi:MCA1, partial [Symbiodinium sp. KB8]
ASGVQAIVRACSATLGCRLEGLCAPLRGHGIRRAGATFTTSGLCTDYVSGGVLAAVMTAVEFRPNIGPHTPVETGVKNSTCALAYRYAEDDSWPEAAPLAASAMGKVCSVLSGRPAPADICAVIKEAEHRAEEWGLLGLGDSRDVSPKAAKQEPLTGARRSLLIGCNYAGTSNELHGCANDVRRMIPVLAKLGFPSDGGSQKVLLDEEGVDGPKPTHANMLEGLDWLVAEAQPGDALLLHYSGHGGREPAEEGGYHETLVPLDFETAGMLRDTELFERLVKRLPEGCRLTCILDSCHSAGALNLPYIFVGTEEELRKAVAGEAVRMALAMRWKSDLEKWRQGSSKELFGDVSSLGKNLWKMYQDGQSGYVTDKETTKGVAVGEVVAITGCRSDQTSADVGDVSTFGLKQVSGSAGGALTSALVEALEGQEELTYAELLERIRQELARKGFSQVPQFVSSLLVELKQPFKLDSIFVEDEQ